MGRTGADLEMEGRKRSLHEWSTVSGKAWGHAREGGHGVVGQEMAVKPRKESRQAEGGTGT